MFDRVEDIATGPQISCCIHLRAVTDKIIRMAPLGVAEGIREVLPGKSPILGHFINIIPPRDQSQCLFAFRNLDIDRP